MRQYFRSVLTSLRSENARAIRSSVTWRSYLSAAIVFVPLFALCTAVLVLDIRQAILGPSDILTLGQLGYYLLYVFLVAPLCLFVIWQPLRLLISAEQYIFREVLLERPAPRYRFVAFTVTFPDHLDQTIQTETLQVPMTMVSHTGHPALVAYNPKTQLTVLIRPLEDTPADSGT